MKYEVVTIPHFDRLFKRLAKKYPSLKDDLVQLTKILAEEPKTGVSLGNDCYKIRFAITSKSKGKSGGGRVVTHIKISQSRVFLLSVYDKSEQEDISDKVLAQLLKTLPEL